MGILFINIWALVFCGTIQSPYLSSFEVSLSSNKKYVNTKLFNKISFFVRNYKKLFACAHNGDFFVCFLHRSEVSIELNYLKY